MACEADIAMLFMAALAKERTLTLASKHHTDALVQWPTPNDQLVHLLIEFKYSHDFTKPLDLTTVLAQAVHYLERLLTKEADAPALVALVSKHNFVVIHTSILTPFVHVAPNWPKPSSPSQKLVNILAKLDHGCYVHPLDFKSLNLFVRECEIMVETGDQVRQPLTLDNLELVFLAFRQTVQELKEQDPNLVMDAFFGCLLDPKAFYVHPSNKALMVTPNENLRLKSKLYAAFHKRFGGTYRPSQIHALIGSRDRLLDEEVRRRQGGFFTPSHAVKFSRHRITQVLGNNWTKECLVADFACGTGNLTRGLPCSQLVLTTLEVSELQHAQHQHAVTAAYNFLSMEPLPSQVDQTLKTHSDKPLVVFMNPPYSTGSAKSLEAGKHKKGVGNTAVKQAMDAKNMSMKGQAYTQFMYRITELVQEYSFPEVYVALFTPIAFLSTASAPKFTDYWTSTYAYQSGAMMNAGHFSGVKDTWPIAFTIWKYAPGTKIPEQFTLELVDGKDELTPVGTHTFDRIRPEEVINKWWKLDGNGADAPQLSSGVKVWQHGCGSVMPGSLLYLVSDSNCVNSNGSLVCLMSSTAKFGQGCSLTPENWRKGMATYVARKLVKPSWQKSKDEYHAPKNTDSEAYARWLADAHVWALLSTGNNCSSLRTVKYKGKEYSIPNHMFWLTRAQALHLYDETSTLVEYEDCQAGDEEPYLATVLPTLTLGATATACLAALQDLFDQSLSMRTVFDEGCPKQQVRNWDAGVCQLKFLWKAHFKEEWKALQALWSALGDELIVGVYEFGFLLRE